MKSLSEAWEEGFEMASNCDDNEFDGYIPNPYDTEHWRELEAARGQVIEAAKQSCETNALKCWCRDSEDCSGCVQRRAVRKLRELEESAAK